ncbi:MAG: chemotaxis protein CheD [candidate division Zixibacteria bacterium]|nr:chemotaxis protein CheD [candidate division Zixibacteria bacterium]
MIDSLRDKTSIDVDTGEVRTSSEPVVLRSIALGSCVAVVVYDRTHKTGGLAHIMLPGRSMKTESENRTKYAEDAVDTVLEAVTKLGTDTDNLEICVVGGANVLQEGDISDKVTKSVKDYLKEIGLRWDKERVGGIERRSVFLDVESGQVFITEGEGTANEL